MPGQVRGAMSGALADNLPGALGLGINAHCDLNPAHVRLDDPRQARPAALGGTKGHKLGQQG